MNEQIFNHDRKLVTCTDDDIITNLSDHLIELILERLPIEDAVRTSILSKTWRYRWTRRRELSFLLEFTIYEKFGAYDYSGFITIINQIMTHHKGPISKFRLYIPNIYLDSFQEVDQWMLILSKKGVKELMFMNSNKYYQIPSSVFSCLELRKLQFSRCGFKPPLEFQGFPNLESLNLSYVDFGGNLGINVINLPRLKELSLKSCVYVKNFNIIAENLGNMEVDNCPDAMLLKLCNSKHLYAVDICSSKCIKDFVPVERVNLTTLFSSLPNLSHFTTDGYFLKFLASEKFPKCLPCSVIRLKQLKIYSLSFSDLDQVQGALCILRNSPNLELLRVPYVLKGRKADMESTSRYLESPDCLNQTVLMLRTVEITDFEGSKPELLFVKLLLYHSPHLEKMFIIPKENTNAKKRLKIAKDVMLFPRASRKAKMVYLDSLIHFYMYKNNDNN